MLYIIFATLALAAAVISTRLLSSTLGNQINPSIELSPPQIEKGQKLHISFVASPIKDFKLSCVDGFIMAKKYDGYSGSWLDKSDLPVVSSGTILYKAKFSFGSDIFIEQDKDNKITGMIIIPEDALPTEIRGIMQIHWFVVLRIKSLPFIPSVTINEELIVLRKTIYDGVPTMAGLEAFNFEEPEEEFQVKELTWTDAPKKPAVAQSTIRMSKPAPIANNEKVLEDKSDRLKIKYKTPFDPGKKIQQESETIQPALPPAGAPPLITQEEMGRQEKPAGIKIGSRKPAWPPLPEDLQQEQTQEKAESTEPQPPPRQSRLKLQPWTPARQLDNHENESKDETLAAISFSEESAPDLKEKIEKTAPTEEFPKTEKEEDAGKFKAKYSFDQEVDPRIDPSRIPSKYRTHHNITSKPAAGHTLKRKDMQPQISRIKKPANIPDQKEI